MIDSILRSILAGSLYALMALGLTLAYASSRFPNFAHGELITVGAYISTLLSKVSSFILATPIAAMTSALVAIAMYRFAVGPLLKRMTFTIALMVATFAIGLMIRNIVGLLADFFHLLSLKSIISETILFRIGDGRVTNLFVGGTVTALTFMLCLHLLLSRTMLGKKMRAAAENPELALVCGINTDFTSTVSWGIAGALAGVAGSFWSVYTSISPSVGFLVFLTFFAAAVIGGFVSFYGTIVGAYVIGFAENLVMDLANIYLDVDLAFKPLIAFIIIIFVLAVRSMSMDRPFFKLCILPRYKKE